jgi:hypothetical protein
LGKKKRIEHNFDAIFGRGKSVDTVIIPTTLTSGTEDIAISNPLLRPSMLRAIDVVVEQDARAIETRYPHQPAKIRLPNEEVINYAEGLYRDWH